MKAFLVNMIRHEDIGSKLIVLFGFSLPLSVAVNNFFAIALLLLWLYQKEYRKTLELVKSSKVLMAALLFYGLHIVGLLWTEDLMFGLHMLKKEWIFLLLPVMMSFVKKEHFVYYIGAFLLAMSISELLSYAIWFQIIPPFGSAIPDDPTPFMSHISYNPFLAFTSYILGYFLLFDKALSVKQKIVYMFFFCTISINMFITGGRAGQFAYFIVIVLLSFQYFNKSAVKAMLITLLVSGSVSFLAYTKSDIFHKRINQMVDEVKYFDTHSQGNVGIRLNWALNTLKIVEQHPLIGVGTGDFKNEYIKINMQQTPHLKATQHPHNMYLLEMAQFGVLGLMSLVFMLYTQLKASMEEEDHAKRHIGAMLPLLFLVIMFSDCYLLGHYTTMLFIYFSAILYKPDNEIHA